METSSYLSNFTPNATTRYSIWSGADNLLVGNSPSPEAAQSAVNSVKTAMTDLENAGARNLLVINMPKIGDTPYAQENGATYIAAANVYSTSYNAAMNSAIAELRADPTFLATIYFVDVYTPLEQVVASVTTTGSYSPDFFVPGAPVTITNFSDKALTYFQTNGTYPDGYFFWDIVHPTTQRHALIAGLALQSIAAVPEPSTACMALAVLACGGFSMWRRRKRVGDHAATLDLAPAARAIR